MKLRLQSLLLIVSLLLITACNNETSSKYPPEQEKTIDVSLRITPTIEQTETPMSRTAQRDEQDGLGVYAINVYWKGKGLTNYQPYVCGLFDNVSNIHIKLIAGYQYRFDCTFLSNNNLPYFSTENDTLRYGKPFAVNNGTEYAPITNRLTISLAPFDKNNLLYTGAYRGETEISQNVFLARPSLYRYYGSSEIDLIQSDETPVSINIELLRAYCTVQFKSEGLPQGDSLQIFLAGTHPFTLIGKGKGTDLESEDRLLSLVETASRWNGHITSSESASIKVLYRPNDAEEWINLYDQNPFITIKRNTKNRFRFIHLDELIDQIGHANIGEGELNGIPTDPNEQDIP